MTQLFLEDQALITILMLVAMLRVAMEIYGVKLSSFPIGQKAPEFSRKIHKYGLYMSIGYIILFAPEVLLS